MLDLITGIVPAAVLFVFALTLAIHAKSIPLFIICTFVFGLFVYDFVRTIREGNSQS